MTKKSSKYVQQDVDGTWSCKLCPKKGLTRSGVYAHLDKQHTLHEGSLAASEASR
jgi:hypothetical protein